MSPRKPCGKAAGPPCRIDAVRGALRWTLAALALLALASAAAAQRAVDFPPAEGKPPPPAKSPPKTQSSGEDTGVIPDFGPSMRKTQQRTPPPPTNLTVMYKLEYGETLQYTHPDGTVQSFEQWKSFPGDGSRLITFTNQRLADGMNYQYATKPLASEAFDPVDIPLLYMAGDYDFVFTDAEVENLRRFLLDGGTILFNAARGRHEFSRAAAREMGRVFPGKVFIRMPLDHPVFNSRYRMSQVMTMAGGVRNMGPPELYSIDIGTRAAAILVPWGLGAAWSNEAYHPQGRHLIGEPAIRLGVNLVSYVLASTEYGRFLAQEFPVYSQSTRMGDVLRFAIARYNGSWDDYPALQNSVLRAMQDNTGIGVDYSPTFTDLDDPLIGRYPLIFMTGHYDFEFSDEELANLRRYLERGGRIFASAAAGLKPFDLGFRREMARVFPEAQFIKLPPSHPMFARGWIPLDRVEYSPAALRDDPLLEQVEFYGLFVDGRIAVLYTPYDLMTGVNHEPNPYSKGLVGDDATRAVIDIITWFLTH